MSKKEIEVRARFDKKEFAKIASRLESLCGKAKITKRFSYMGFGKTAEKTFDIRIRITNGYAEIVYKIGSLHASDRTELSQPVNPDQMPGLIRQVFEIADRSILASRRTMVFFDQKTAIEYALVDAEPVYYLEVERLAEANENIKELEKQVLKELEGLGATALTEEGFNKLNLDLNEFCDEEYLCTTKQNKKIKEQIRSIK